MKRYKKTKLKVIVSILDRYKYPHNFLQDNGYKLFHCTHIEAYERISDGRVFVVISCKKSRKYVRSLVLVELTASYIRDLNLNT